MEDDIKIEICKTLLKSMFKDNYYSICSVDKIISILNIKVDWDLYNTLHALHCIHFNEMSEKLRRYSYNATIQLLSEWSGFDFNSLNKIWWNILKPFWLN